MMTDKNFLNSLSAFFGRTDVLVASYLLLSLLFLFVCLFVGLLLALVQ